ncbi:MAG: ABC transporter permease [Chthoniobacteraceae bacterium]
MPHIKLRPASGWQALNLAQIWQFRDLAFAFAGRDIKLRYRQTFLGIAWVVFQPLMAAGIFSFVFGRIAKLDTSFIFSYVGMLGWNVFNSTLTKSSGCLVQNAGLISKVFFPRLILPVSIIFSTLIDFAIAFAVLFVLAFFYKIRPGTELFLMPVWIALLLALATGFGLFASALMVSYRDVQYILPVLTQLLLFASPIGYSVADVPMRYRNLYDLNPLVGLLEGFRWSLLGGTAPDWQNVEYSTGITLFFLVAGAFVFKKMERQFADVI